MSPPEPPLFDLLAGLDGIQLDETALRAAVADGTLVCVDSTDEVSDELVRVSRRIAGQMTEVIGRTVARLYAEPTMGTKAEELLSAVDSLRELAFVVEDQEQVAVLDELLVGLRDALGRSEKVGRQRLLPRLRAWIPRYARFLDADDRAALLRLVAVDPGASPVYRDLECIPGMGRRRLERLWAAGLYSPEQVAGCDPADLALVTGMPRPLAGEVVGKARSFLEQAPRRFVGEVRDRLRHLQALTAVRAGDAALADEVRAAIEEMHRVLARVEDQGGAP